VRYWAAAAAIGALLAMWASAPASAHVTVISPYTFNQHVLPILRARCGTCHGEHAPGRPLLEFDQAQRNQVEIARSLMVGRMPPWSAEAGAAGFKGQPPLTPREVDMLMTWAAGGAPQGTAPVVAATAPPGIAPAAAAPQSPPDLMLQMRSAFVFDPAQSTAIHEEVFAAGAARGRAIRGVDVLAGDPSIVRRAEVAIRTRAGDRTIALWIPGDTTQMLEADAAYAVPRDASIVLRVHYMRQPGGDTAARSDRSRLGLFFSHQRNAPNPRDLVIEGSGVFRVDQTRVISRRIERTVRALALRPVSGPVDAIVALDIVGTDGERRPLARLQLRANWPRRYIFTTPVTLPAGARIDARVSRRDPMMWSTLTGDGGIPAAEDPLRIAIEIID
jgi:hypothetical protein